MWKKKNWTFLRLLYSYCKCSYILVINGHDKNTVLQKIKKEKGWIIGTYNLGGPQGNYAEWKKPNSESYIYTTLYITYQFMLKFWNKLEIENRLVVAGV